jgi:excisionase family DNA binding protein
MEDRFLKIKEVADMLGLSVSFTYLLTKRGELPTIRIGNAIRVRSEDLENYLKGKLAKNEPQSNSLYHKK